MSAQPLLGGQVEEAPLRPRLTLVPYIRPTMSARGFVTLVVLLVALGLTAVMIVSTQVAAQSRELTGLRREVTELEYQAAALTRELQQTSSTASLAMRAADAGMVPNPYPAFIRLSDGAILGDPQPVAGDEADYLRIGRQSSPSARGDR